MSFSNPSPRQAALELVAAGAFWGFGFVATQWALETWNPLGVLLWRFVGALIFGEILFLCFRPKRKTDWKSDFKGAAPAGFFLGSFLLLQTIGLQYTTASKSGFITTLYVIFVPIANRIFFQKKIGLPSWVLIFGACLGTFLLMDMGVATFTGEVNVGDLWTLACAVVATAHIIYIGRFSERIQNPFRVNNFQSLWGLLTILPVMALMPQIQTGSVTSKAIGGIVILAIACSVLAFFLQVRAQKVLEDSTASVLFLLESPYAFVFAYFLIGDRLNATQSLGALLILCAALGIVALESGSTSKVQS